MAPLSESAKSDILKGLMQEVAALKEVIAISTRRKAACEHLISVMTLSSTTDGASTSQPSHSACPDEEETEDGVSSDSQGSHANNVSDPSG